MALALRHAESWSRYSTLCTSDIAPLPKIEMRRRSQGPIQPLVGRLLLSDNGSRAATSRRYMVAISPIKAHAASDCSFISKTLNAIICAGFAFHRPTSRRSLPPALVGGASGQLSTASSTSSRKVALLCKDVPPRTTLTPGLLALTWAIILASS